MKRLLHSLQHFSISSHQHAELFSKLTLESLGFYVTSDDAVKYMRDHTYPLGDKAFMLKHRIGGGQHELEKQSGRPAPHAWKASAEDVLGCSTLFQDERVTLCWFVIPPGRVLPLHDHPSMSVWQRVMHGHVHICSMTRNAVPSAEVASPNAISSATVSFSGSVVGDPRAVMESDVLTFTDQAGGVLHEIRNLDTATPALFVDIIAPPYYQAPTNIPCTYYRAEPIGQLCKSLRDTPADCGVLHELSVGDRVALHARPEYSGPAMEAFVYLGG